MEIVNSQTFDFTTIDEDEDSFDILVESLKAMEVNKGEIPGNIEMEMIRNSPHGLYGVYRARRGSPEVIIADEESPLHSARYFYKIKVYLLDPEAEDLYEDVVTTIQTLIEEKNKPTF